MTTAIYFISVLLGIALSVIVRRMFARRSRHRTETRKLVAQTFSDPENFDGGSGVLATRALKKLYLSSPERTQKDLGNIFHEWIISGTQSEAVYGITLIRELGLVTYLPFLEDQLKRLRQGKSDFPFYFEDWLVPAIEKLKQIERGSS